MSRRKKKNAITMISLLLALVALIGFYLWYSDKDQQRDEKDGTGAVIEGIENNLTLATLDESLLQSFHIINSEIDMELLLQDGTWISKAEPGRPIKQENIKNMLRNLYQVDAKRIINEKPEDLAEYGLIKPQLYLRAVQTDGKTLTLKVGERAVGGEGYYALVDDRETIYLLDNRFGTGFHYSNLEMTALEVVPVIDSGNIYHVEVQRQDGENFELLYDTTNKADYSIRGMFPWVILQPYEEGYSADGTKVTEILPKFADFTLNTHVDYSGEKLALYGLDDPAASILVEYYETYMEELEVPEFDPDTGEKITEKVNAREQSFRLYVGNKVENDYYVKLEGSDSVYTMKAEKVDAMLNVDAFQAMASYIRIPMIDSVNRIDITIEGKLHIMEIQRETTQNDKGEEKVNASYYYNGNAVEEKTFKGVYQAMISAQYDTKIIGEVTGAESEPFMTITYYIDEDEKTLTTSYLPYDDSFYMIDTGYPIRFFADKRKIDEIATRVIEFKAPEE